MLESSRFNQLTTYEKLQTMYEQWNLGLKEKDMSLYDVACMIDDFERNALGNNDIQLVMFLNEEERGRGCIWCGG